MRGRSNMLRHLLTCLAFLSNYISYVYLFLSLSHLLDLFHSISLTLSLSLSLSLCLSPYPFGDSLMVCLFLSFFLYLFSCPSSILPITCFLATTHPFPLTRTPPTPRRPFCSHSRGARAPSSCVSASFARAWSSAARGSHCTLFFSNRSPAPRRVRRSSIGRPRP